MTPPREGLTDYEAKARDLWHSLRTDAVQAVPAIAAALRAAEASALKQALTPDGRCYDDCVYAMKARELLRALVPSPESPPAKETRNAGLRSGSHPDVATVDRADLSGHQSTDGDVAHGLLEEAREMVDVLAAEHAADLVARIDAYLAAPAPSAAEKRIAELEAAIRWALGEEPLKDGRWFDPAAFGHLGKVAPYWWRSILRLYSGLASRTASPGAPGKEEGW